MDNSAHRVFTKKCSQFGRLSISTFNKSKENVKNMTRDFCRELKQCGLGRSLAAKHKTQWSSVESCAALTTHSVEKAGDRKVGGGAVLGGAVRLLIIIMNEDRRSGQRCLISYIKQNVHYKKLSRLKC